MPEPARPLVVVSHGVAKRTSGDGRPLAHSDFPLFCALAVQARAEAGPQAATDLLVQTFCDVSDVDQDHFTWVAAVDRGPLTVPIAATTFRRSEDDLVCAQAAIGVDSSYRGQGLGQALYEKLAATARTHGIETFLAEVSLRRSSDVSGLSYLGLKACSLGADRGILRWSLGDDAPPAALLVVLERGVADALNKFQPTNFEEWSTSQALCFGGR